MDSSVEKFRVAVVTVLEVDAVDWIDAAHVAEGAVKHALRHAAEPTDEQWLTHTVKWRHVNGHDYEARVARQPCEVGTAMYNGYMHLEVTQPAGEED